MGGITVAVATEIVKDFLTEAGSLVKVTSAWLWAPSGMPNVVSVLALAVVAYFMILGLRAIPMKGPEAPFHGGVYYDRLWTWSGFHSDGSIKNLRPLCPNDAAAMRVLHGDDRSGDVVYRCPICEKPWTVLGPDSERVKALINLDIDTDRWKARARQFEKARRAASEKVRTEA